MDGTIMSHAVLKKTNNIMAGAVMNNGHELLSHPITKPQALNS